MIYALLEAVNTPQTPFKNVACDVRVFLQLLWSFIFVPVTCGDDTYAPPFERFPPVCIYSSNRCFSSILSLFHINKAPPGCNDDVLRMLIRAFHRLFTTSITRFRGVALNSFDLIYNLQSFSWLFRLIWEWQNQWQPVLSWPWENANTNSVGSAGHVRVAHLQKSKISLYL